MIEYAQKMANWESWMPEYRFGAFYIFPPDDIIRPIDDLRKQYDPKSDAICQAHISLSESLAKPLTDADITEFQSILSEIEPFEITYGPLRDFPPHPGVCYRIEPESGFRKLRNALHSASSFKDVPLRREHIAPHMTVAEFVSVERTKELLQELSGKVPEGTFLCDEIELAVPDESFYFKRALKLRLGK